MSKLYFRNLDDERCYDLQAHEDYMRENELIELVLYEAKRETGVDYFYCRMFEEVGERGVCGFYNCAKYKANNGKSGRCKHYGYCYEKTNKKFILKLNKE